jgi:gamma-butyrobetaine dioxygenase
MQVSVDHPIVSVQWDHGGQSQFHTIWLRDNCGCEECRVALSGERLLYTADIADELRTVDAFVGDAGDLDISFSDGHRSVFSQDWLLHYDYSADSGRHAAEQPLLWGQDVRLPEFDYAALMASSSALLEYLDAVQAYGAAVVRNTPAAEGEVVRFAKATGVIREVAFGTVHDVLNNPDGYNVAHTELELKPHSDLASYSWPPSFQLLHYLLNEVTGGETILVDGWSVLAELEREDPESYNLLARIPVAFKIFSITHDTYAEEPIIQLHSDGRVKLFRFSNQTAQPLRIPPDMVEPFYKAYKKLGRLILEDRFRVKIKALSGDMLTIHNHRILHGRTAYDPRSGNRHLQDLYMEWDDVMAKRRVLRGHLPLEAWPRKEAPEPSSSI